MPVKKALRPAVQLCFGVIVHKDRTFIPDAVDIGRFRPPSNRDGRCSVHPADIVPMIKTMFGFFSCAVAGSDDASPSTTRNAATTRLPFRILIKLLLSFSHFGEKSMRADFSLGSARRL